MQGLRWCASAAAVVEVGATTPRCPPPSRCGRGRWRGSVAPERRPDDKLAVHAGAVKAGATDPPQSGTASALSHAQYYVIALDLDVERA